MTIPIFFRDSYSLSVAIATAYIAAVTVHRARIVCDAHPEIHEIHIKHYTIYVYTARCVGTFVCIYKRRGQIYFPIPNVHRANAKVYKRHCEGGIQIHKLEQCPTTFCTKKRKEEKNMLADTLTRTQTNDFFFKLKNTVARLE